MEDKNCILQDVKFIYAYHTIKVEYYSKNPWPLGIRTIPNAVGLVGSQDNVILLLLFSAWPRHPPAGITISSETPENSFSQFANWCKYHSWQQWLHLDFTHR